MMNQFPRILCIFLLTASILTGCKKADEVVTPVVSVQAEKAEVKPLTEYVSGDAVLTAKAEAAIVPKISAPVKQFLVQRGARVRKGQLLAVLENADLTAALLDSRGALKQAEASYITTTKAGVIEDQQKARLDLAQAKANLDVSESAFDARQSLLQQGAIPKRDFETTRAALVQAKAAYDIAEQHLKSLNSVSQAATVQNVEGARESAQARYQAAQAGLAYSQIRSPIDGVVTDRPLFAGEMANAGQAIVTVMDTSTLIAKVHLSQPQAASLKVGADAMVTIPGEDKPVKAKVSLISPVLDTGSTTLEVWVAIPNKSAQYREGTNVHVSLASETVSDALSIPNESIIASKSGSPAVMVIGADGVAHQKAVKTGISDGQDTQILSGLLAGDLVVTKGAYGMDDATKVKVVAAGAADEDEKAESGAAAKSAAGKAKDGDEK